MAQTPGPAGRAAPAAGDTGWLSSTPRLWFFGVLALVVLVAVLAGVIQGGDDLTSPGRIVLQGQLALSSAGDISPGAHPPSRQQPSTKEWTELEGLLQARAKDSPGDPKIQESLALVYYNLGRFDQAAGIYRALLARGENARLRDYLGNVLRDKGDLTGAEAAYRQALAHDATLAAAYLNLAEVFWRQGRDQAALDILDRGMKEVGTKDRPALERARSAIAGKAAGPTI